MQAKTTREKNVEFLSNVTVKVEITDKPEKSNIDAKIDVANVSTSKDPLEKEFLPYEKKYFSLLHRCELLKQSNERLVNRIYYVKKLLRRRKKERKFLMDRLDGYGDDYKSAAVELFSEALGDSSPGRQGPSRDTSKKGISNTDILVKIKTEAPDT
ncbi:hypothetical protein JTE90_007817 [Oedothorax gibbosus]|uniref:INO80 complex subunit F domain-containing protein n=1 Tax=Oedothorax gibbosus TaxID=931172 RepID=A0AAV6VH38_9ARAC|nr:hypothetical protein JTE90_007817 [Oedothorax gibbosus]